MTSVNRKGALAAAFMILLACGDATRSPEASPGRDELTTITLLTPGDDFLLSPLGFLPEMHFVSDPLNLIAEEPVRQGETRTWLYRLRPGIRWHDGAPFTTRDIAFSSDFYQHPDVAMEDPEATTLQVLDDSTFTITYHRGYPVSFTYGVYLPAHILADRDPADRHDWDYWRQPIGYGPFRYGRTQPGEFIELEANPDWHLGRPRMDRVVLKLGGNPLAELMSGNVDIAMVTGGEVVVVAADPRFEVKSDVGRKMTHLFWNHRHPALGDVGVRRALAHAIDRLELARALDFPPVYFERRLRDVDASERQIVEDAYPDAIPFDTETAEALLEEAGWTDQDGDGMRERGGAPLRFRLLMNEARQSIAVVLQSQWRRIGVDVLLDIVDQSVALGRVRQGDFDAFISSGNLSNAQETLTNDGSRRSLAGYRNPVFDSVWVAVNAATSEEEADAALAALWPIVHEDVPVTLLLPYGGGALAIHRRVRGLNVIQMLSIDLPFMWVDEEWEAGIPTEETGGRR
jgi:peptide/nickel transport system substrate-binding protein